MEEEEQKGVVLLYSYGRGHDRKCQKVPKIIREDKAARPMHGDCSQFSQQITREVTC